MTTKEKILSKALELFNDNGYNVITTRHIAKELNMSPGNLHYHFKHSREIVVALLMDLLNKSEELMNHFKNDDHITISKLHKYLQSVLELFYEFKFFSISLVDILREVPELRNNFLEVYQKREMQFEEVIKTFQKIGIFNVMLPDKLVESVIAQVFVIADSNITYNRIIKDFNTEDAVNYYSQIMLNLFLPLFTDQERENYIKYYLS